MYGFSYTLLCLLLLCRFNRGDTFSRVRYPRTPTYLQAAATNGTTRTSWALESGFSTTQFGTFIMTSKCGGCTISVDTNGVLFSNITGLTWVQKEVYLFIDSESNTTSTSISAVPTPYGIPDNVQASILSKLSATIMTTYPCTKNSSDQRSDSVKWCSTLTEAHNYAILSTSNLAMPDGNTLYVLYIQPLNSC
jgi:hypothetical protein